MFDAPDRPPRRNPRTPARPRAAHRGRRRRGAPRDPHRTARGRRRRSAWSGTSTDAVRARCVGLELVAEPEPGPAGHQDRQRGARRHPRRRDPQDHAMPASRRRSSSSPASRARARPPPSAKLARWFRQQGRNPLLVGADLQRPAAVEQLRVLGGQAGVPSSARPPIRWPWPRRASRRPAASGATSSSWTPPGGSPSTQDLMDEIRRHLGCGDPRLHLPGHRRDDRSGRGRDGAGVPRDARRSTASS